MLNCLYIEFPEHFTWSVQTKSWHHHQHKETIGRILSVHPSKGEGYCIRILLMHIRKLTSSKDLRTINGFTCLTRRDVTNM